MDILVLLNKDLNTKNTFGVKFNVYLMPKIHAFLFLCLTYN